MSLVIGHQAEQQVARYLVARGLRLIEKNYRCKLGEIDLIMQDHACRVFVEVRYRKRQNYGYSWETVNLPKRRKLIATARHYLQKKGLYERVYCRFDVVGVTGSGQIEWFRDAFQCG